MKRVVRCRDEAGVVHAAIHTFPAEADVYCQPKSLRCLSFWTVSKPLEGITCKGCREALMKELGIVEDERSETSDA